MMGQKGEFPGLLRLETAIFNQICDNCKRVKKYIKRWITE